MDSERAQDRRRQCHRSGPQAFPSTDAEMVAELIRRDLPYYDPSISPEFGTGMYQSAQLARDEGPQ